ncbi:MAG: hypothetical protein ABIQ31_16890 [Ferruginibacter sp.]
MLFAISAGLCWGIWGVLAKFIAFTIVLALIFLKEKFSIAEGTGLALALTGAYLLSVENKKSLQVETDLTNHTNKLQLAMNKMYQEIAEIPLAIENFFAAKQTVELPMRVPYMGMGSSYFACMAFKYMGINIYPEIASEYYNYLAAGKKSPCGVILSQSGKSRESAWRTGLFEKYIAISNDPESTLCIQPNLEHAILLNAGTEEYSSSKTYSNTLLALFQGFRIDTREAANLLVSGMADYEQQGSRIASHIFTDLPHRQSKGYYILGSGPNIATAKQAALILSELTKISFQGVAMAQYDHGPKETATDSTVIHIMSRGKSHQRAIELNKKIKEAGATVFTVEEASVSEGQSVLSNIVPFNFVGYHLAKHLNIDQTFVVGGKVTEVSG